VKVLIQVLSATLFLIPSLLLAKKTDGQFNIQYDATTISIVAKKGFHLNDKAPAYVVFDENKEKQKPTIKTESKFSFDKKEKITKAKLSFYVCDDAKTVCEQQEQTINLTEKSNSKDPSTQSQMTTKKELSQEASQYKKITLLVFSAPWCPACIRFHSETMETASFKQVTKSIDLKEINVDLVENEQIADQYGVKAIPTIVLVNQNGEEISRWLDYQTEKPFVAQIKLALKDVKSIDEKIKKAQDGDVKAAIEIGYNSFAKMNWANAVKWLSYSRAQKDINYKLAAEVNLALDELSKDDQSKKNYLAALEKAFTLTTSIIDSLRWKIDYLEQTKEQEKSQDLAAIESAAKQTAALLKRTDIKTLFKDSTYGDVENFETVELVDLQLKLALLDEKNKTAAADIKKTMFKALNQIKLSTQKPGQIISAVHYYSQAGYPEKSEELLKSLVLENPKTYVYYQKYSTFLVKQKKHKEALEQIELALKFKEGNEPQLNLAKIKILKELGQKKEALNLIEVTKKLAEPYPTKYKRTVAQLNDLKTSLEKVENSEK